MRLSRHLGGASQGKQAARVVGSSHRNTEPDSKEHASDLSGTTQRAGTPQPLPPSFLGPEWASPCGGCHLTATPRDCPSKAQAKDPNPRGSNSPQIVVPFCARPDLLHTRAHTPGGGGAPLLTGPFHNLLRHPSEKTVLPGKPTRSPVASSGLSFALIWRSCPCQTWDQVHRTGK